MEGIQEDVKNQNGVARVSIQGVKSIWWNRVVFSRLGTGDDDRWPISKGSPPVSVPGA